MSMNMMANKKFTSVLLNEKGEAVEGDKKDAVNDEAYLEEAVGGLIKAIHEKDAKKALRAFKALVRECIDEYEAEEDQFDGMKFSESDD